jgi:hypothetical protein
MTDQVPPFFYHDVMIEFILLEKIYPEDLRCCLQMIGRIMN